MYLNVTTPVVGLMLNEEQSMEYVLVAPTSGSVTSNDGFPTVVPAFNNEIYQSTKLHFNKVIGKCIFIKLIRSSLNNMYMPIKISFNKCYDVLKNTWKSLLVKWFK